MEKRTAMFLRGWGAIPGPPHPGCVTSASRLTSLSFAVQWVNGDANALRWGRCAGQWLSRPQEPAGAARTRGVGSGRAGPRPSRRVRAARRLRVGGRARGVCCTCTCAPRPRERPAGGRLSPRAAVSPRHPAARPARLKGQARAAQDPLHQPGPGIYT